MYLQTFNRQEIIGVFTVDSKRNLVGFNKMNKQKIQHCSKIQSKRMACLYKIMHDVLGDEMSTSSDIDPVVVTE
jgi:hypothetical protein